MDKLADQLRRSREALKHRPDGNWWMAYNSSIEDYERTFKAVLEGRHIMDLVKDRDEPVVVDLMSSTKAIADLFEQLPQSNKLGIAVSIQDDRSEVERVRDDRIGVKHITGDLSLPSTWKELKGKLVSRKADLILERGGAAVFYVPTNEEYFGYVFNRLWENISDNNGVILVQGTTTDALKRMGIRVQEWANLLNQNSVETVFSEGRDDLGLDDWTTIKLVRTPKSPASLPVLK